MTKPLKEYGLTPERIGVLAAFIKKSIEAIDEALQRKEEEMESMTQSTERITNLLKEVGLPADLVDEVAGKTQADRAERTQRMFEEFKEKVHAEYQYKELLALQPILFELKFDLDNE